MLIDLTYEELCLDSTGTLDRICQFTGLDPARFSPDIKQVQVQKQNYKWSQRLDAGLISRMNAAMEPLLSQRNYL